MHMYMIDWYVHMCMTYLLSLESISSTSSQANLASFDVAPYFLLAANAASTASELSVRDWSFVVEYPNNLLLFSDGVKEDTVARIARNTKDVFAIMLSLFMFM